MSPPSPISITTASEGAPGRYLSDEELEPYEPEFEVPRSMRYEMLESVGSSHSRSHIQSPSQSPSQSQGQGQPSGQRHEESSLSRSGSGVGSEDRSESRSRRPGESASGASASGGNGTIDSTLSGKRYTYTYAAASPGLELDLDMDYHETVRDRDSDHGDEGTNAALLELGLDTSTTQSHSGAHGRLGSDPYAYAYTPPRYAQLPLHASPGRRAPPRERERERAYSDYSGSFGRARGAHAHAPHRHELGHAHGHGHSQSMSVGASLSQAQAQQMEREASRTSHASHASRTSAGRASGAGAGAGVRRSEGYSPLMGIGERERDSTDARGHVPAYAHTPSGHTRSYSAYTPARSVSMSQPPPGASASASGASASLAGSPRRTRTRTHDLKLELNTRRNSAATSAHSHAHVAHGLGLGYGQGYGYGHGHGHGIHDDDEFADYEHEHGTRDDKVWTEGDFELVSADRVRFRIPSYYLFAASAVFREASAPGEVGIDSGSRLPSRRYVHFSDEGESAVVLRLFLEFIVYAKLDVPDDGTTLSGLATVKDLVTFLKKWECSGTLALVLACVREAVRAPSAVSPLAAFVAGGTAGDAFTCSVALDITDWSWRMMDRHMPAAPDANVFDPHHMPVAVWQLIPPMYTWALTTAWTGTDEHPREGRPSASASAAASRRSRAAPSGGGVSDSASRVESVLDRKVHAWQQWL